MNPCVIFLIISVVQKGYAVIYDLSDEEHERMPPTFSLDPFDKCLRHSGGRYCTAYARYVADGDSPLLTLMQEYSDHASSHFNHTRALFGLCVSHKCKDIERITSDPRILLEQCLNRTVWNDYKLKVKVDEEVFCHEHGEKEPNVGVVDVAVAAIVLALLACNIIGSLFEILYPKQVGLVSRFLQCFSITRNWKILTAPACDFDPRIERLKGIYGIRAISMTGVILVHGLLPGILTTENTKFVEDLYNSKYFHVLLNGGLIMQTFLFLSAFLLIHSCQMQSERRQITWKLLPLTILKRWLRLSLPYALVLALTATWLPRLNTGPIWGHVVVLESEACRRDWWQHLIYINNYCEQQCMPQTWYLAADFQLHCIGLVIFVCCQRVVIRKLVLSVLFVAGMIIPALHTYYQDLDGPLISSPGAGVTMFTTDRTFNTVYKQAHTNISCYVMGLAAGHIVYSLQRNNFDATKYKAWRPLYWLLFPLAVAMTVACKVFYTSPRVGMLYRVAAAALLKPVFGLLMTLIIVGMILKIDNLYRGILEWSGWVTLSRVSYSAFLVHLAYIRATCGIADHPLRASYLRTAEMILFTITMVYIAAYFFWLTVEAPLTQVVKTCLQISPVSDKKEQ